MLKKYSTEKNRISCLSWLFLSFDNKQCKRKAKICDVCCRRTIIFRFHWRNRCQCAQFISFFIIIMIMSRFFYRNFCITLTQCMECGREKKNVKRHAVLRETIFGINACNLICNFWKICKNDREKFDFFCRNLFATMCAVAKPRSPWSALRLLLSFDCSKYAKAIRNLKLHDKEANTRSERIMSIIWMRNHNHSKVQIKFIQSLSKIEFA